MFNPIPGTHMPDCSYLAVIRGKIEDPAGSTSSRKKWKKVEKVVRVIQPTASSGSLDNKYIGSSHNGQRNCYPLSQTLGH